jgi:hypothetical protein
MSGGQLRSQKRTEATKDDIYMQIWQGEQDHTRTRWTVTTFFLSISFAILEAVLKGLGSRGKCDRMEEKEDVRTGNRECWC